IAVAHGSESLEKVTLANLLRRAGLPVIVASVEAERWLKGTRGIDFAADVRLSELAAHEFAMIALPGGEAGALALA
ncbi:DJ-1/PfpI family protein, partial [Escherichia coli]|uniref:DJ-1/PfpI family protein n=1 Tax=Escherichia coli TaxID=562 RepID=UPI0039E1BDD1